MENNLAGKISEITGEVKYTPHHDGLNLVIPFKYLSLELGEENEDNLDRKREIEGQIKNIEAVFFQVPRIPDIKRNDLIKIKPSDNEQFYHENIYAEEITVMNEGRNKKIATYYR